MTEGSTRELMRDLKEFAETLTDYITCSMGDYSSHEPTQDVDVLLARCDEWEERHR